MGKETNPPQGPEDGSGFDAVNLKDALEERYLAYALSTIMNRALPDVRDGLKPVHRRILHAMRLLRLDPNAGFKKSARVVGDVIGKFHPHGDQAVYDALVRLAQNFAVRYPLVDGQGNFGNIDGDNPAAMRYTESRLTDVASLLLEGINENAVDVRQTYDEEDEEPIVLPANFPNLLANGSSGIAVGMATSIPPHNAAELCDAARYLIKHPEAGTAKLVEFVPGPDFPTGGIIVEKRAAILEAYETGRGGFRVRAKWETEDLGRGQWVVIVTEIPYQVPKSRLIEKIADLLTAKKLPLLGDIRDESAEDIRIVFEPKSKNVDPALMMETLFKLTDLETRISLNMNVLSGGLVPKVMGLRDVLREWLEHRKEVLVRRSNFRLDKINHRLEVLGGYLIAYLNIDEVIRIIREEDEAKPALMSTFELTDLQAESILNMRLRSLRKLEEFEIRKEYDALSEEKSNLEALLASDDKQWADVSEQIKKVKKAYGPDTELGRRRSKFADAPDHDISDIETAMIEKEPITVVLSEKGWIRALRGHISDTSNLTFKSGDSLQCALPCQTTDRLLVLSTGGKIFTMTTDKLPGGRGHGEPVRILLGLEEGQDVRAVFVHKPGRKLLIASTSGRAFIAEEDALLSSTRNGKQVLNVTAPDEAKIITEADGDRVAVVGTNRKILIFPTEQLPTMNRGKGVRLQRYKDGQVADVKVFNAADGLSWTDSAGRQYNRSIDDLKLWCGDRATAGRLAPTGFPRTNSFGGSFASS